MLTQDVDFADSSFLDTYEMFYPYKSMLYSTHSHTKEAPRYRIVTPLTRDVTPEEYVAVSRYIACELGIDYYDECSFLPNQMMYMPTTPSDGEYVFKELDGAVLNPDDILKAHPEWRDVSTLPMSKKEKEIKPKADKKQQNPKDKEGVVGAFCRAYGGITNVIDRFLPDVYRASEVAGRYDYIGGESTAGLVIYDDTFAYSHHATDPASHKLMNAFDIVRIHKFPDSDEKESFKKMSAFAVSLDEVKLLLAQENFNDSDDTEENWQTKLQYNQNGELKASLDNLVLIIRHDEGLNPIAFNCHRDGIDAKGKLPWEQFQCFHAP